MLLIAAAIALIPGQLQTNIPKFVYEMPVVGGQRQMIVGVRPDEYVMMGGWYERDKQLSYKTIPDNTGGFINSINPGGIITDPLGNFDVSCKPTTLFNQPCLQVISSGAWIQKLGRKPNQQEWKNLRKETWWVKEDGTILRHLAQLQTPEGAQAGDCVYGKDSIQRRYTDVRGKTSFAEVYPSCGMDGLNAQFKPMFVDGKVILRDKEFYRFDPLTGGIGKFAIHVSGKFHGEYIQSTFNGTTFDLEGPQGFKQRIFISDEGDLVKVELTPEKFFVISNLPASHMDQYGHPIRKSGGGR